MRFGLIFSCLLVACAPEVQRAALTPVFPDVKTDAADFARVASHPRKLVFKSPSAHVKVFANDLLNGDHHLEYHKVRGTLVVDEATGRGHLHVDVTMPAFEAENGFITSFAGRMLEVYKFRHAIVDAKVEPIDGEPKKRLVTGNITLHGIERGIQFRADVTPQGEGLHLRATFDMSRGAFDIHATAEEGEALIRDDFTVTFDFRCTRERVTVEEDVPPVPQNLDDDAIYPVD